ncbi:unnamed protein product [Moneuplotes crassus]|uniref:Deacetylase sirtuin-type domain-containing protein n=1 Tax=Euplotes crassus TaxID=5936 RepID=A0AAD1XAS5_EUPCR|nr:unnamed protein product [Moneuplotes crassus]
MEKYNPSKEELASIMKKSPDDMTDIEKEIWKVEVLRSVAETTVKCREILSNVEKTKVKLRDTEKVGAEFEKKWQHFQDKFDKTLGTSATKLDCSVKKSIEGVLKKPKKMSPEDASGLLKEKNNIVILTGASLSAASGIPTFRGNDGLWTKKYKYCETPEELATLKFFKAHPEVEWQCTHDFYELCKNAEPNAGHKAIVQFQEHCKLNGKQCHLVTQNIDDLHARLIRESEILKPTVTSEGEPGFGFTDSVYEIHGNLSYSRCSQECSKALKPVQVPDKELSLEDQIPKCEECKSIMRPHMLCFDECYTQELHQVQTIKNIINSKVDALVIVGTANATTMANKLVNECLSRKILTINVNLEPCCDFGPVIEIKGKPEEILPKLFGSFKPESLKSKVKCKKFVKNVNPNGLKEKQKTYSTALRVIASVIKAEQIGKREKCSI